MPLLEIYKALLDKQGFQYWWPGDTNFEICLGAILTQNTAWSNVEKALENLKKAELMLPEKLLATDKTKISRLIKPSGCYNQKTDYIISFCEFILEHPLEKLKNIDIIGARSLLLDINGVGKETADSILLYVVGYPIFVIDAYTRRIFSRIGLCKAGVSYEELQEYFHNNLLTDVELFKDYHAQIVMLGKSTCRKKPICENCILRAQKLCRY